MVKTLRPNAEAAHTSKQSEEKAEVEVSCSPFGMQAEKGMQNLCAAAMVFSGYGMEGQTWIVG